MGIARYIRQNLRHDRNMRQMLHDNALVLESLSVRLREESAQHRADFLREKTMTCRTPGVTDERLCPEELIVSLTSFGERIFDASLAIESIMQGTLLPNRIILWLSEEEFGGRRLPKTLQMQQERGLSIEYCKDIKSYKKLIPSLKAYPDACIITIDDDVMYESDMVERLVFAHMRHPEYICACRMHRMCLDQESKPLSYLRWKHCIDDNVVSPLNFPTSGGGTLFPPHCFSNEILDEESFTELCPKADDVWLYAMALKQGTSRIQVYTAKPQGYYRELPSSGFAPLSKDNTDPDHCLNDLQLQAVFERYNLYPLLHD